MPESRNIADLKERQIHDNLLELYRLCRYAVEQSIVCLENSDIDLAREILEGERHINEMRQLLEQDCLLAIASQQAATTDLHDMVAAMRIAGDLEYIGDYAADIAAVVRQIDARHLKALGIDEIKQMSATCLRMLDESWRAYDERNSELALAAAGMDDEIDRAQAGLIQLLTDKMKQDENLVEAASRLLWVVHCLELCGDRINNIAGQVLFITALAI